jgi:hypothetical protein
LGKTRTAQALLNIQLPEQHVDGIKAFPDKKITQEEVK